MKCQKGPEPSLESAVRKIRKEQHMTIEGFAESLEISPSMIAKIEAGNRRVSPELAQKISDAFSPRYDDDDDGSLFQFTKIREDWLMGKNGYRDQIAEDRAIGESLKQKRSLLFDGTVSLIKSLGYAVELAVPAPENLTNGYECVDAAIGQFNGGYNIHQGDESHHVSMIELREIEKEIQDYTAYIIQKHFTDKVTT